MPITVFSDRQVSQEVYDRKTCRSPIPMFLAYLMTCTLVLSNETLQLRFGSERLNNMHFVKISSNTDALMAVLWFEPSVAVPRLFLPTELHSWLPFGYFSAINDQSLTSSTTACAVFLVV